MPYFVPNVDPKNSFGQDLGKFQGASTKMALDLLVQAFLGGQLGQTPSAGQFTAPGGQSTFVSPAERVASNPSMSAAQAIQNSGQGSFQPTRYSGLQFQPSLDRQLKQAQLGQYNAYTNYLRGQTSQGTGPSPKPPTGSGLTPEDEQKLLQAALAGDENAEKYARALGLF